MTVLKTPNPGSPAAVDLGCKCPVLDNAHGRGMYGDGERFGYWMTASCPLHGNPTAPKPEPAGERQ